MYLYVWQIARGGRKYTGRAKNSAPCVWFLLRKFSGKRLALHEGVAPSFPACPCAPRVTPEDLRHSLRVDNGTGKANFDSAARNDANSVECKRTGS